MWGVNQGLPALWPQISYLTPLSLRFLICQMRLLTATIYGYWGDATCSHAWGIVGGSGTGPSTLCSPAAPSLP